MKYKILVFETYNSLNYWFIYIIYEFISNSNYAVRIDTKKRIINFGLAELRFITYPFKRKLYGLHNAKVFENLETKLERNFEETLYKIIKE